MNSRDLIRDASYFDMVGDIEKADSNIKLAIEKKDFDYYDIYKNPETASDFAINKHLTEEPFEGDTLNYLTDKTTRPERRPTNPSELINYLSGTNKDLMQFADIYPNIYFYFEDGVTKFFHVDPTSLDSLKDQSESSGKLKEQVDEYGDKFTPGNLEIDYFPLEEDDEMYLEPLETRFITDLPQYLGKERIYEILRRNFPAAHIQFIEDIYDDNSHKKEIEISLLDS
jgi:hypothetical protein